MINLIPPQHKNDLLYARRNAFLIRWLIGVALAAAGIIVVAGASIFYLKLDANNYQQSIDATKSNLEAQKETETLNRVSEISGSLKLVVDVLSSQVVFSELLPEIGEIMPPGTVLQNLSLDSGLKGGLDLEVGAVSQQAAAQAQINLADKSNGIFEKADIVSLSCSNASDAGPYPCLMSVRTLFVNGENPFLLLNRESN